MIRLKPIPDFPNYFAHSNGTIYSAKPSGMAEMSVQINNAGYLRVNLYKDNKPYGLYVHRLIASAFHPNHYGLEHVNHKNRNKADCRAKNLEWMSPRENAKHYQQSKRKDNA